jgi:nitrogen regulatory protein PII
MKAILITCNQAYYDAIISIIDRAGIRGFTYWEEVQGRGSHKGEPHYGSHTWPTTNSAFMIILPPDKAPALMKQLQELDRQTEKQGLRAFMWNIEQTI